MEVNRWLWQERQSRALTQQEVSARTNLDLEHVQQLECGQSDAPVWSLVQFCSGLQIDLSNLLRVLGVAVPDPLPRMGGGMRDGSAYVCWPDIATLLRAMPGLTRPQRGILIENVECVPPVDVIGTYTAGGVLLLRDVGHYIADIRCSRGWSREELEQTSGMVDSVILVETGQCQNVRWSSVAGLDARLGQNGLLIGMYWQAYRFYQQLGITPENPSETWNRALGALAWCRMAAGSSRIGG